MPGAMAQREQHLTENHHQHRQAGHLGRLHRTGLDAVGHEDGQQVAAQTGNQQQGGQLKQCCDDISNGSCNHTEVNVSNRMPKRAPDGQAREVFAQQDESPVRGRKDQGAESVPVKAKLVDEKVDEHEHGEHD